MSRLHRALTWTIKYKVPSIVSFADWGAVHKTHVTIREERTRQLHPLRGVEPRHRRQSCSGTQHSSRRRLALRSLRAARRRVLALHASKGDGQSSPRACAIARTDMCLFRACATPMSCRLSWSLPTICYFPPAFWRGRHAMATERQIAANRRNAARSTGPRTARGKMQSRMNALRHGLASAFGEAPTEPALDLDALSDRLMRIEGEKIELLREIDERLRQRDGADIKPHLRRLAALDRYAQRSFSALRKRR